jgi:hypothetical protein
MTPLALWAAVALVALVATACWAILARETAVYVTSGLSFTAWSWLAIVGGDVAMLTASGPEWIRIVASLQFTCLALAIISLVVFSLRLLGAYPTPQQNAAESTSSAETTAD